MIKPNVLWIKLIKLDLVSNDWSLEWLNSQMIDPVGEILSRSEQTTIEK